MPVVPATVEALVPDQLIVYWSKGALIGNVEGFLAHLLKNDGLGAFLLGNGGPSLLIDVGANYCMLTPGQDLFSMMVAEEVAAKLVRFQSGHVMDGSGRILATADLAESHGWRALESVGIMSQFRPRPTDSTDLYSHPLIPIDDCKITGVSFNDEGDLILDLYFDYWARPCAFLVDEGAEGEEPVLLYRPMYRYRRAIFERPQRSSIRISAPPQSQIHAAFGVRGYKVSQHSVSRVGTWVVRAQKGDLQVRTRAAGAWLTRSLPTWSHTDPLLLDFPTKRLFETEELLQRKEQHWDITDAIWEQEWYVAANEDGTLNPYGRIYRADPTCALLDLPGLKPKWS